MNQQNTPAFPKKKGGIWFFILPIVFITCLLILKNLPSKSEKNISKLTTQFTPEELINLVENYDINDIAGACVGRGFIQFNHENCDNYGPCTQYTFIHLAKELDDDDKKTEAQCQNVMNEAVLLFDNEKSMDYHFINEADYNAFLERLQNVQGIAIYSGEKYKGYENYPHYMKNNVVITAGGYCVETRRYFFFFTRREEIPRVNKKMA